jgi:Rrf2 family transcriptional regulator, iron-sulfur cluster assembly transcription factor
MHQDQPRISRREIAQAMRIPLDYLGKVAQALARAGIIAVRQGAQGGYELAQAPGEVTLLRVVEAMDGEIFLNDCIMRPDMCGRSPLCQVHRVWDQARTQLRATLAAVSMADLAREELSCRALGA